MFGPLVALLVALVLAGPANAQISAACDDFDLTGPRENRNMCWAYPSMYRSLDEGGAAGGTIGRYISVADANEGASVISGEPEAFPGFEKSLWQGLRFGEKRKVVVSTIGTTANTYLAVYRNPTLTAGGFVPVVSNDDFGLGPVATNNAIVTFTAKRDTDYYVQTGTGTGTSAPILLNTAVFPPEGGLSAFVFMRNTTTSANGDIVCAFSSAPDVDCGSVSFMLHNSTSRTLAIETTSDLGAGMGLPSTFTLAPGQAAVKAVTFLDDFDTSTSRTQKGHIRFVGRDGTTVVSSASRRVLLNSSMDDPSVKLSAKASPNLTAQRGQLPAVFDFTLSNKGSTKAKNCFAASSFQTAWRVEFQRLSSKTGKPVGQVNAPFDVAAGKNVKFRAKVRSHMPMAGISYSYFGLVSIGCSNVSFFSIEGLRSIAAFSAVYDHEPARVVTRAGSPEKGVLAMAAGKRKKFRFSAVNKGRSRKVKVTAEYLRPNTENDPAILYGVAICRTRTESGPCISAPSASVTLQARKGRLYHFALVVKGAAINPGFDPDLRRAAAVFREAGAGILPYPIGMASIATKRK